MRTLGICSLVAATLLAGTAFSAEEKAAPDKAELEKKFAELMTGAALVGSFNVDGKENAPKAERYIISKAEKLGDDRWKLSYQYNDKGVEIPIIVDIKWAGDTPVITMTDFTIPTLGTFTSRVLFYDNRYAGTWQHGKAGGLLWGRIERANAGK